MPPTLRAAALSGWLPAGLLAGAAGVVLVTFGTPFRDIAIFSAYVAFGLVLPGMLWVRRLRGRARHISEDLAMGLAVGYCVEIATYLVARAAGTPILFLLWPILTLIAFIAVPGLRPYWRGEGTRAPARWSWSLALIFGYLLVYSAGTFFAQHHLTGTDTPHVDMPYHLALIGELRHHVPPAFPYVIGKPLAYHWFFYAEAAATSWATGIEPVTLLYRLSGLPMFVAFVVLTAAAARRLTGGWWTGPVAVAVALLGVVAGPYGWIPDSVPDTQTLLATWTSPTNLLGLALFAALILAFIDLLRAEAPAPRSNWLLVAILVFGAAGAKASLLPLLIGGLATVVLGVAVSRRRLDTTAAAGLGLALVAFALAAILIFRGTSGGLTLGLGAMQSFPVSLSIGARGVRGWASIVPPIVALLIALVLWSFLWAGAYGLLNRWREVRVNPSILLLLGICASALGAVSLFLYPGLNQLYYLRGAAGAFGILTAAGIAALLPGLPRSRPLVAMVSLAALVGAASIATIQALGPVDAPSLVRDRLSGVLVALSLPVLGLVAIVGAAYLVIRAARRRAPALRDAGPILIVALVMGFSVPRVASVVASPFTAASAAGAAVPGDGIAAARWLRDHSDSDELVATNLHCRPTPDTPNVCDSRHFWVTGYSERRILVEGWGDRAAPFWDQELFAQNQLAFANPSPAALANLHDTYGVRWLFADLTMADGETLGRLADLRHLEGEFAVYELRQP